MKNISIFLTDCYGGRGGIAQYNRNLVDALVTINEIKKINIFQRKIVYKPEKIPKKVNLIKKTNNSKIKFILKTIYHLFLEKNQNLFFVVIYIYYLLPGY